MRDRVNREDQGDGQSGHELRGHNEGDQPPGFQTPHGSGEVPPDAVPVPHGQENNNPGAEFIYIIEQAYGSDATSESKVIDCFKEKLDALWCAADSILEVQKKYPVVFDRLTFLEYPGSKIFMWTDECGEPVIIVRALEVK